MFKSNKVFILFPVCMFVFTSLTGQEKPEVPRIDYVVPLSEQAHENDKHVIWYDDFNGEQKEYGEGGTNFDNSMSYGGKGKSLLCFYEKGEQGTGGAKVFFADAPSYPTKKVRKGEKFDEVYWRIYVKHEYGWTGAPAKMSRATSLTSSRWAQSMIAHVWSGSGSSLTLDPACGVKDDKVVTRSYNDFEKLKWLGNKPNSEFPIHATKESGYWVLVESRAKLNTPGKSDGINQLWIDGRLECERRNLNFRGNYDEHGINAVYLEAYWNDGSVRTQSRWYDNFIISTEPIGPVQCSSNPKIVKTPFRGSEKAGKWELEVAADFNGDDVVFISNQLNENTRPFINIENGEFIGKLQGKKKLDYGKVYYIRVRQSNSKGVFSDWSRWHQGFKVE